MAVTGAFERGGVSVVEKIKEVVECSPHTHTHTHIHIIDELSEKVAMKTAFKSRDVDD